MYLIYEACLICLIYLVYLIYLIYLIYCHLFDLFDLSNLSGGWKIRKAEKVGDGKGYAILKVRNGLTGMAEKLCVHGHHQPPPAQTSLATRTICLV